MKLAMKKDADLDEIDLESGSNNNLARKSNEMLVENDQNVNRFRLIFMHFDHITIRRNLFIIAAVLTLFLFIGTIIITHYSSKYTTVKIEYVTPTFPTTTKAPLPDFRLPADLIPSLYELQIKTYIGSKENEYYPIDMENTFEGTIKMHLTCVNPTRKVVFHSKNLKLKCISIDANVNDCKQYETNNVTDFVTFQLDSNCKKDQVLQVNVDFSGRIATELFGFYSSSYTDSKNEKHVLALTKFEPHYARRAFPCLDEPSMKAKFKISLIRVPEYRTLSNNPVASTEDYEESPSCNDCEEITSSEKPKWKVDRYNETVKMSTYLVAYVICDFDEPISKESQTNVVIEVAGRPDAIKNGLGDYALEHSADIIDYYAEYFSVEYPLSKSTQIAIPDFNSGAMENWGLITYRESSLLYDSNTDAIANKKRVAEVVAHELAHQWFGNLVTMKWWDDLWLNEGFATWISFFGLDKTNPEWKDLDYFYVNKISVLTKDAFETSHPISANVIDPNDVPSIFDSISYDKGASILRMITAFLTEDTFKKGVSSYLENNKFSNAEQDDLWAELTKRAHEDEVLSLDLTVKQIMDTFTLKMGYPVIEIFKKATSDNDTENDSVKQVEYSVKQKWFLLNPKSKVKDNQTDYESYKWFIPVTFTTLEEKDFDFDKRPTWFLPNQNELILNVNVTSDETWLIANIKHAGFYRVNYDDDNWSLLINQLKNDYNQIDEVSRAQILDDLFNLGRAELIKMDKFLEAIDYVKKETSPLVFIPLFSSLNYLSEMLAVDYETFESFKEFVKKTLLPTYERLGWREDVTEFADINLQIQTCQIMCSFGYQDCVDKSKEYMEKYVFGSDKFPNYLNNFRNIIYQTYIKYGNDDDWNRLYKKAQSLPSSDYAEKLRMNKALTATTNLRLLKLILQKLSGDDFVRKQDETGILADVASNVVGRRLAFDYLDENWDYFLDKYGKISFTLANLVSNVFSKLSTEFDLKNLLLFKEKHPDFGVAYKAYDETLEIVRTNIRFRETYSEDLAEWLKNQN